MRNATHELVGASVGLAAAHVVSADSILTAITVGAAVCGSRLPDVDQVGARVHRRTRLERRGLLLGGAGAILRLSLVAFALVARHRGVTHSLAACAVLVAGAALLGGALPFVVFGAWGVALGYGAHVLADACTPSGVRLWAPFSSRRVGLLPAGARIATGSARELLVAVAALATVIVLLVM